MSAPNLPDILARLAAATPGPWHRMTVPDGDPIDGLTSEDYLTVCVGAMDSGHNETFIADAETDADADLIAHAPGDLAALAARVAALEAENAAQRAEILLWASGGAPSGWICIPGPSHTEPYFRRLADDGGQRYCLNVDTFGDGGVGWAVVRWAGTHWVAVACGSAPGRSILKAMAAAEACFTAATEATP